MYLFLATYVLFSAQQQPSRGLIPGPQIYSHCFDGLSLVQPVSQNTWMGWLQTFIGTAVSAVETILLAVEAQFCWGGAHISSLKCVKPHQSSAIRPAGSFSPLCLGPPLSSIQILLLLLFKISHIYFLASFAVISPLIFSSCISSSFTVFLHCLLNFLCPSS